MTEGNRLKRYIGVTDEPLCADGQKALKEKRERLFAENGAGLLKNQPCPERLFVSPLLRCRETAEILFPDMQQVVIPELAECDFGDFENKNYLELSDNADYQAWVDSGGTLPFPNGESREEVCTRNLQGLRKVLDICARDQISFAALVIHGGTIMNLMDAWGEPKRSFYEWHVDNGCGYLVNAEQNSGRIILQELTEL